MKARILGDEHATKGKMTMFRSFDFDVAVVLAFDAATYSIVWAREIAPTDLEASASYSAHTNAHRIALSKMNALGADVFVLIRLVGGIEAERIAGIARPLGGLGDIHLAFDVESRGRSAIEQAAIEQDLGGRF